MEEQDRISTGFGEVDRVLGDGIVAGSWCWWGRSGYRKIPPFCFRYAESGRARDSGVLYISGEESLKQIKMKTNRIGPVTETEIL